LKTQLEGKLKEIKLVGKNRYLLVRMERKDKSEKVVQKYIHYHIFSFETGEYVFNYKCNNLLEDSPEDVRNVICMGMLVCEKKKKGLEEDQ